MNPRTILAASALALAGFAAQAAEPIKMATISPGSSAYLTMTTFAQIVNGAQDDYDISVDATGAATKHMIETAQGKIDLCLSSPVLYDFLKTQTAMYQKLDQSAEYAENLRLLMWYPYGEVHVIVHADSGIERFEDIRGKRVFLGPPGGGAWTGSYLFLKNAAGLDQKAGDYENVKASWSSAFQGFQDRQFDVYIAAGVSPAPNFEQFALTSKIRLLGLSEEEYANTPALQTYIAASSGRAEGVIRKGAYGENVLFDHDIHTLDSKVGIAVRADLPEEAVYAITRAFWTNLEAQRASTPWLDKITLDYAVSGGGMPMHAGAARFYREIGIQLPDERS